MRLAKPQPEPESINLMDLQGAKVEPRKRKVVPVWSSSIIFRFCRENGSWADDVIADQQQWCAPKVELQLTRLPWQVLRWMLLLLCLLLAHLVHFTIFCLHLHSQDGAGSCPWHLSSIPHWMSHCPLVFWCQKWEHTSQIRFYLLHWYRNWKLANKVQISIEIVALEAKPLIENVDIDCNNF